MSLTRRTFLKNSLAVAATGSVLPILYPEWVEADTPGTPGTQPVHFTDLEFWGPGNTGSPEFQVGKVYRLRPRCARGIGLDPFRVKNRQHRSSSGHSQAVLEKRSASQ